VIVMIKRYKEFLIKEPSHPGRGIGSNVAEIK
jgi:hypothetical protein